ncbi:YceI family protein [Flavobacteriaceae bacterium S356]|uniref:YceI family protein n=1 Tax=Asprobacillus argus TaxID=3076534 RepID=A0ABU3LD22_9FLAO|nr:YceI family protein [Flavobacteriaceae bacterium S356]
MKKIIIASMLIASFSVTLNAQEKLKVNPTKSTLHWYGYYTFYFGGHDGTINIIEGHFIKTNEKITGGEFNIDMTSIKSTDVKNKKANKSLVNHLKDPDFFDVKKYPTAKVVITKVDYHDATHARIEANLTLKGVTKSINFQVEFNFEALTMTTKFKIDRTRWGVNYNSKMKDGAISDAIGFEVKLSL